MHPLPSHLGHHSNAKSVFTSASGDSFGVPRMSPFAVTGPWQDLGSLLSGASEGAHALCILGNANAIGKF